MFYKWVDRNKQDQGPGDVKDQPMNNDGWYVGVNAEPTFDIDL